MLSYRLHMQNRIAMTVVQAILYLLKSHPVLNKIQTIKLLFLADKYHLIHYGRTVTGDQYWAMRMGPVGSIAKNILSVEDNRPNPLPVDVIGFVEKNLEVFENSYRSKNKKCNFEMLSDSDKEALSFVLKEFGNIDSFKLRDYTHEYPEWKQYESFFKANPHQRKKITQKELFSVIDNKFGLSKSEVSQALEVFSDC